MSIPRATLPLLAVLLLVPSSAPAQGYDESAQVYSLYQRYLGRDPNPNEVGPWIQALRSGLPISEIQVRFLNTDEFWARRNRDPQSFVVGLYHLILGRNPNEYEIDNWVRRYQVNRGNRDTVVREFQAAAERETATRPPPPGPPGLPGVNLPAQLTFATNAVVESVALDLGGTRYGRSLALRANNLDQAARAFGDAADRQAGRRELNRLLEEVAIGLDALQAELARVPGGAPNTSRAADRVAALIGAMRGNGSPPPGPPNRPPTQEELNRQFMSLLEALVAESRSVVDGLRASPGRDRNDRSLLYDAERFSSLAVGIRNAAARGARTSELQEHYSRLTSQATVVSQWVRSGRLFAGVVDSWMAVERRLAEIGKFAGLSAAVPLDAGMPTPLHPPAYSGLPYSYATIPTAAPGNALASEIDSTLTQVDAMTLGVSPVLSQDGLRMGSASRDLRTALLRLREAVRSNAPPRDLQSRMNDVNVRVNVAVNVQVNARDSSALPPLTGLQQSVNRLDRLVRGHP